MTIHHDAAAGALHAALDEFPLIAILRGLRPEEAVDVATVLAERGFRVIEVPLNSPSPLDSIRAIAQALPHCVIGAGTVIDPGMVPAIRDAGGRIIVMPHADVAVIHAAKDAGMACMPGVATPTEAFAALAAGADGLKLFPAELIGPSVLRAMRSILPREVRLAPVGGITPDNMEPFLDAGANAFGLGSALYKPGLTAQDVAMRAEAFAAALHRIRAS